MKLFTIFGNPVTHSRSPLMHNSVFKALNIDACYTRTRLMEGSELRNVFFDKGLSGANITVPHKEAAFNACDEIRGIAREIGAVNTIVLEEGKLVGYNTDADGFYAAVESFGKLSNALILGAGGTARALAIVLRSHNITPTILNRSASRLQYFIDNGFDTALWDNFLSSDYDIVINTTSAGLNDDEFPLPKALLTPILEHAKAAVDVIYGKKTPFLHEVIKHNLPFKDGSDMLLEQGVLANYLFIDKRYPASLIHKTMKYSFSL